ncbi:RNA cytidine acetyltransferase [Portunus trituberculatus]|uniref:RNA cytidine acetyltransferase n=1 Tax=Portunus trituberculatus TaxID=210409 RepID=A0A5B7EJI6_PORTR|nr:RNA cytidine acetyltransferase [Portunus trituberculatus]
MVDLGIPNSVDVQRTQRETPERLTAKVMILHHLLTKAAGERHSVLWCHKKDSDIPRHSRKHLKKLEKNISSGKCDISKENAFDLFLLSTPVKYCAFQDSHRLLGNTFGMCVIQDFEGLTPNTLCRVVETVCGGGLVVFLMPEIQSLRQLFSASMDIHSRLKTYSHPKVTPLFNERSLGVVTLAYDTQNEEHPFQIAGTCLGLAEQSWDGFISQ